jgi:CRP-like cAMP-binding protein
MEMERHAWIDERLQGVPMFVDLSRKQLRQISSLMTQAARPTGTVLIEEGRAGHEFFIVLEGKVEVRHDDKVIATRGAGEYFGEIALLDNRPRTATVVVVEPVVIEVLSRQEFKSLLAQSPELAHEIMATMARRLAGSAETT